MSNSLKSFAWKDIGDIAKGRPTMGVKMHVAVYRMFQYSLRNVLENKYGKDAIKHILVEAGRVSGIEFCTHLLDIDLAPPDFFDALKQKMEELGIGLLEVVQADFENLIFILTVSEDLDCSGVPVSGETVCHYDEGLVMGILEKYTGKQFVVKETDCWSTGHWACRFHVVAI
ncbi:V4R domain-containing protein [Candidatus Formimonas warabiya]|uniref:4-vinyl reductase n=1 Tax=Formimonas warabiya TaxID=1761012 RepID=A0A3G1KMN1_FORW1|nr:V4R domain-containing protein [Candidatus Formimonas warabiya]ATW23711.1 4-vinyl reductase [Candidatus Formimonas warabiya]